jgi:protein-arginine kinase activator protein McsA
VVKIKLTKPELNAGIRELKVLKGQALESNENRKAAALRQQISQLKKKSRRVAAA